MKPSNRFQPLSILGAAVLVACPLHAAITYVDAVTSVSGDSGTANTVLDGVGTWGTTSATETDDGKWQLRPRSTVNGVGILVASQGENASPRLATTITLPGPGEYEIYGYFWINNNGIYSLPATSGSGHWDIAFQLGSSGTLTAYNALLANATNISGVTVGDHFTVSTVKVDDGTQDLFEASLGTWNTATQGLTVTIYIDDPQQAGVLDNRTWYDGVGYAIPEPSAALLGGLATLFLLRRRRR